MRLARVINHAAVTAEELGIPTLEMCIASHESDDQGILEHWTLQSAQKRGGR